MPFRAYYACNAYRLAPPRPRRRASLMRRDALPLHITRLIPRKLTPQEMHTLRILRGHCTNCQLILLSGNRVILLHTAERDPQRLLHMGREAAACFTPQRISLGQNTVRSDRLWLHSVQADDAPHACVCRLSRSQTFPVDEEFPHQWPHRDALAIVTREASRTKDNSKEECS